MLERELRVSDSAAANSVPTADQTPDETFGRDGCHALAAEVSQAAHSGAGSWIGDRETLDRRWVGYDIHHWSAIFDSAQQFGRIKGGSNVQMVYRSTTGEPESGTDQKAR